MQHGCMHFSEKHTAENIANEIDRYLFQLGCDSEDTLATTDCGANVVAATNSRIWIDCAEHRHQYRLEMCPEQYRDLKQLNDDYHQLVSYVNHANGVQEELPYTLKHGGVTIPCRSLYFVFYSIRKSSEKLREVLVPRKREYLITRIDTDLLNLLTEFLKPIASVFDNWSMPMCQRYKMFYHPSIYCGTNGKHQEMTVQILEFWRSSSLKRSTTK